MFPGWVWWSPTWYLPFSGAVNQEIAPETDWFSDNVTPRSGDAEIERRVVREVGSYGRQLGAVTDVLLALAETAEADGRIEGNALSQLRQIRDRVNAVKLSRRDEQREHVRGLLREMRDKDPAGFTQTLRLFSRDSADSPDDA